MNTIAHRELRNSSSEILRRVRAGETFEITNHGEVVAVISPPRHDPLRGVPHQPAEVRGGFSTLERQPADVSVADVLDDLRGER